MTGRGRLQRLLAVAAVILATAAALAALHPTTGAAATCTDDFTGLNMGLWQTASNWTSASDPSTHAVPKPSDIACLEGMTVVVSAGSQTAGSVHGGGGSLTITGATLTLSSTSDSSTLDDLSLDDSGGLTAPVAQTIGVDGNFEWGNCSPCGDEIALSATIKQTGGGTFAIDGNDNGISGPTLTGGSLTTSRPVSITNQLFGSTGAQSLTTTSTITLGPGLQLSALSPATTITAAGIAPNSGNYGFWTSPLVLTGGTTTVAINSTLETGRLTVEGGTLKDDSGITAGPGGSLTTTLTGGTLTGQGNIGGPVTNIGATVLPGDATPGTFTISGNYTQEAGGTLAIGIDGTPHGLLQVTGTATLGGDLQLTDVNGFTPSAGEEWVLIPSKPTQTGTFTLTGPSAGLYTVTYSSDAVDLFPRASAPPPSPPANVTPPAISGTPSPGVTLSCSQGSWTNNPTSYKYQWNRDGVDIPGATTDTYGAQFTDVGHQLTCTVVAANNAGPGPAATSPVVTVQNVTVADTTTTTTTTTATSTSATSPPARLGVPVDTIVPALSGKPTPGHTLTCTTGTWTNSPTAYAYRWSRSPRALPTAATGPAYAVQIADEGSTLTCTVTASNAAGAGSPATSAPIVVAEPGTLHCVRPTGKLARLSLGPLALGLTRAQARRILPRFAVTANDFDNFCLYGGWGIRVGYATGKVLTPLSKTARSHVSGRIVLALTANPFYALRGVRPGMVLATAAKKLKLGPPFHIGSNFWYVAAGTPARGVLKVRGGIIQEVGLANEQLTSGTPASQRRFLSSFPNTPL